MKNKTVCMLVTNSIRKDPRVQREASIAAQNRFNVWVIGVEDEFYDEEFFKYLNYEVDIIKLNKELRLSKNFLKRLYRRGYRFLFFILKTISKKPDIIHANDLNTLLQAWIASLFTNAKVVYDSHELNVEWDKEKLTLSEYSNKVLEHFLIHKIAQVISVSHASAAILKEKYSIIPVVVTNCPYQIKIESSSILENNKFDVLYHGIISQDRGYEELALAGKYVSDNVRIIIRGYGPIKETIMKIIDNNNLQQKVILDPPVEILDLIPKASLSKVGVVLTKPVNANFKNTVSNKVFEYLNAGIPVILSDVPEHRYLNDKYNIGIIVDSVDERYIAKAILELETNIGLYNTLKKNAVQASKLLCWEVEGLKLISTYNRLIKG